MTDGTGPLTAAWRAATRQSATISRGQFTTVTVDGFNAAPVHTPNSVHIRLDA